MSLAYVSSPGVPGIRPKNFSGVGIVSEAGRWSTSSVLIRGSCVYSLILAVYSSSSFCLAGWRDCASGFRPGLSRSNDSTASAKRTSELRSGAPLIDPPPSRRAEMSGYSTTTAGQEEWAREQPLNADGSSKASRSETALRDHDALNQSLRLERSA